MKNVRAYEADEIKHQIGNSMLTIGMCYSGYCRNPMLLKRNIPVMLFESRRLVKKLEKICGEEGIL